MYCCGSGGQVAENGRKLRLPPGRLDLGGETVEDGGELRFKIAVLSNRQGSKIFKDKQTDFIHDIKYNRIRNTTCRAYYNNPCSFHL